MNHSKDHSDFSTEASDDFDQVSVDNAISYLYDTHHNSEQTPSQSIFDESSTSFRVSVDIDRFRAAVVGLRLPSPRSRTARDEGGSIRQRLKRQNTPTLIVTLTSTHIRLQNQLRHMVIEAEIPLKWISIPTPSNDISFAVSHEKIDALYGKNSSRIGGSLAISYDEPAQELRLDQGSLSLGIRAQPLEKPCPALRREAERAQCASFSALEYASALHKLAESGVKADGALVEEGRVAMGGLNGAADYISSALTGLHFDVKKEQFRSVISLLSRIKVGKTKTRVHGDKIFMLNEVITATFTTQASNSILHLEKFDSSENSGIAFDLNGHETRKAFLVHSIVTHKQKAEHEAVTLEHPAMTEGLKTFSSSSAFGGKISNGKARISGQTLNLMEHFEIKLSNKDMISSTHLSDNALLHFKLTKSCLMHILDADNFRMRHLIRIMQ